MPNETEEANENEVLTPAEEAAQVRANGLLYLLLARMAWLTDGDGGLPPAPDDVAVLWSSQPQKRLELFASQRGTAAEPLVRWWNGVLALGAAIPAVPTSNQVRIFPFSYAAPAHEAIAWWSGQGLPLINEATGEPVLLGKPVNWASGVTVQQVALNIADVRAMEKQHLEDPELISSWLTPGGTRYYMQVSALQVALPQFPPSVAEWGVPTMRPVAQSFNFLVPLDAPEAMPYDGRINPIMHNPVNRTRTEAMWRCSSIWSDQIAGSWGWQNRDVHIQLRPVLIDRQITPDGFGSRYGDNEEHVGAQAYIENGIIKYYCRVNRPLATYEAHLRQPPPPGGGIAGQSKTQLPGVPRNTNNAGNAFDHYGEGMFKLMLNTELTIVEGSMTTIPARFSRLTSHQILATALKGRDDPDLQWIDSGLQNLFSVAMADTIARQPEGLPDILMPVPPQLTDEMGTHLGGQMAGFHRLSLRAEFERQARTAAKAANSPYQEQVGDEFGDPLENESSTRMVRFLYEEYGQGAVEETLQRMGAGATFDTALKATTGDGKAQFLEKFGRQ
ncbi:hypothetical protein EON80_19495 [bacterium]|nr:MAG: hypothetical protein EON80_19495 [bacterium]